MKIRFILAVLLAWHGAVSAADIASDYDANYLLFEAHPLNADTPATLPFTSVAAAAKPELVTGAAPASLPAPIIDRAAAEATVAAYQDKIESMMSVETPYSRELFEQLIGLASAYQQLGQHDEALTTLERAEFLGRVNNGLYSPEQFAVVGMMVESLMASGQMNEAMQKQQYLLYLQRQHYGVDSTALAPGLERLGDWATTAFNNGVHGSDSIGFSFSGGSSRTVLSPRGFALASLDRARFHYFDAIGKLVTARDLDNPQLPGLEQKLLHNLYLAGHRTGLMDNPSFYLAARRYNTGSRISVDEFEYNMYYYEQGRNALQRLQYYQTRFQPTSADQLLHTFLSIADWSLLFNRQRDAEAGYQQAYALVRDNPVLATAGQQQLNPTLPVLLPDFMPLPHSRGYFGIADDKPVAFEGYLDVSFDVMRSGDVKHVRVLGKSSNVTSAIERRLRRLLGSTPQRPRLENGQPVAHDDIKVRYYFADMRGVAPTFNQ